MFPHLFNINHVNKVAIIGDSLKFYFNVNKEITGVSAMGYGFLSGNSLHSVVVKYANKEEAEKAFDEVAKLM
jgi:hypothetical protein